MLHLAPLVQLFIASWSALVCITVDQASKVFVNPFNSSSEERGATGKTLEKLREHLAAFTVLGNLLPEVGARERPSMHAYGATQKSCYIATFAEVRPLVCKGGRLHDL